MTIVKVIDAKIINVDHFLVEKTKTLENLLIFKGCDCFLWYLQESNQGHMDFQSIALPTELRYRYLHSVLSGNAGANIEPFLYYPKQNIKKINLYLYPVNTVKMLLAVDVGNTKIKAAVFKDDTLSGRFVFNAVEAVKAIENIFAKYPTINAAILSSVVNASPEVLQTLENRVAFITVNHDTPVPFKNLYSTPHTLGIDRIVLSSGAVLNHPAQNRLVIDAGTCITYDFIDDNDRYYGGAISPGIRLRYEALHNFTAKLPLLHREMPESVTGKSTAQSIHSGVVNALVFEIQGFIDYYENKYDNLVVILTGGDAEFLAERFKNTIFANSNFLLESLNQLYLYTQK
jgi:type III pantothenate kinase